MIDFFTQSEWDEISTSDDPITKKLVSVVTLMLNLVSQIPSEHTDVVWRYLGVIVSEDGEHNYLYPRDGVPPEGMHFAQSVKGIMVRDTTGALADSFRDLPFCPTSIPGKGDNAVV